MTFRSRVRFTTGVSFVLVACSVAHAQQEGTRVPVNWDKLERVSQTEPTLLVEVNPLLRRENPVSANAWKALRSLGANYVRYMPYPTHPKLSVAELEPPKSARTSWDFSLLDPLTMDFLDSTKGHPAVFCVSTMPQWMWKTEKPIPYPADPNQTTYEYYRVSEPRDPTFKELADYYARFLSWYTKGGFTDELGKRHESGYHYSIPYWEVLNEPDGAQTPPAMSPETYTKLYDVVVTALRKVQPSLKFVGMSLALPSQNPHFFKYFLDHRNHKSGIPLDVISYHFYAWGTPDETPEIQGYTFFRQVDGFLNTVRYVETMRKQLSPQTRTMINEIGTYWNNVKKPIPRSHWSLAGAVYAYVFGELTRMGIDAAAESLLVGNPAEDPPGSLGFSDTTMLDSTTGNPNPQFLVLELLRDNFGPGDKVVALNSRFNDPYVYAMPVITKEGKRRVLLVNKSQNTKRAQLLGASGGQVLWVDRTTASGPPARSKVTNDTITLGGYAVAVVTLPY